MTARAYTVAFEGVEARRVEVQCAVSPGVPSFAVVGLPDKAVTEAKERVRAAMTAMAIALPSKRITINLSPADLPKEGSHFDLPIALALLAAAGVLPPEEVEGCVALGELSLDGSLVPVIGALPAAMAAAEDERVLICPAACAPEAAWVGAATVIGPATLAEAIAHLTDRAPIEPAAPGELRRTEAGGCLRDVRGQERAKRALEIAAAGRHHLLMVGPPGAGKSMLAARLPGILPPMSARETLETSMIHSISGLIEEGRIGRERPCMSPHHTASMAAIVGGWPRRQAGPDEHGAQRRPLHGRAAGVPPAPCWRPCASRSRPARSWSPAPTRMSATPAGSSWWRRRTRAGADTSPSRPAPAPRRRAAARTTWLASRGR